MNENIFEKYPVLIAHEYWRLTESWNNGDLENACWKVKDLFSIVLKLPVLVYGSVLAAKEDRSDAENALLFELLERRMTFGTWHSVGQSMSKSPQFRSFSPELACILSDMIDIYNRRQIPNWRNNRFTKDGSQLHSTADLRPDIEAKLSLFRQHFAACDDAYSQLRLLMVNSGESFELGGKDALSNFGGEQAELWIEIEDLRFALRPYFLLQEGQIYVFDSHDIRRDRTGFVNYTDGKHLIFEGQQTPNPLFTQLYEQTYKGRESRQSSTEAGASHVSHNDSTALLYAFENKFPYPIARAFYQLRHIHDWKAQIPQLANILGLLLQHIAMIALAEYLSGDVRDEKLNQELLQAFKNPVTHGAWLKIADRLLKLLRQRQHQMFMPELLEFYFPERGEEALPSLKTMSGELVQMRNFLLKRIPEFSPARREYEHFKHQLLALLQSLKFLADYPLISVEHTQAQEGVKIHTCYRHIGFHDSFARATLQSELDFDRMRPALLNLRTAEVLYLYPLYALQSSEIETPPLLLLRFGVFDQEKQCIRYAVIKEKHSDEQAAMKKGEEHHQEGLDFWGLLQDRSPLTLRRKATHCYLEGEDLWQQRAVGDVIADRYEILEHLRRGGMADVYKVTDRHDGTLRALKLLPFQFLNDYTILQRFRSEASEARRLTHEKITQVLDAGATLADHYLVMELATGWNIAEGQSAIDVSELPRPVTEQTVLSIARQTCEALEYIHRQPGRLVHRDIKPGNLLLFEDGRVKITDFGIARSREALKLTLTGLPIGTPEYMSPEQAQGERELTPASDLYSLGIVMYELLAGQTPFRRKTALQTMYAIVHDPVPPLRKLNPAVSKALEQIVMTCLQKTPQERFQSAQELYEALQSYHGHEEFTRCRLCGRPVQLSETFRCGACGLEELCIAFCLDTTQHQCIECSTKADQRAKTGSDHEQRTRADRLLALENPDASFKIRIWTERSETRRTTRNILVVPKQEFSQYRLGEKVTAYFESSADAYVYMLNIGPTGDMTPIFPNDYSSDNHVKSGRQYTFPDESAPFDWILQEPAGAEIIKVIAAKVSLDIERFLDEQLSTAKTRNIGVRPRVPDTLSPDQWAEAACTLLVKKE